MKIKSGVDFLGTILGIHLFFKYGSVNYIAGMMISDEFHFPYFS